MNAKNPNCKEIVTSSNAAEVGRLDELVGADWRDCPHRFSSYFGPLLKCELCGATTMLAAARGESKPIDPPHSAKAYAPRGGCGSHRWEWQADGRQHCRYCDVVRPNTAVSRPPKGTENA